MIHLHTSKTFNDDLKKSGCALTSVENKNIAWNWYAHRITLMRKKCIIVMEENSRYALIFVGLKKKDFAQFDKILASRIVAEACWLCDLSQPGSNEQLIAAVEQKCLSTIWSQGLDRSVQSHIRQVADDVEYLVHCRFERLPASAKEEFSLGCLINDRYRKRKGDNDYFVPCKVWRTSLLALLAPQTMSNVVSLADFKKSRGNI